MTELLLRLFVKDAQNLASPVVRAACGRLAGWVGIVCNLLLALGKLAAGFFSGSIAVTADALNNFSDASSSVITLLGFRLAQKPADEEHPFGHARFEYIAGLAVALFVMLIGIELAQSSVGKILSPQPAHFAWPSFAVLAASILMKLWMTAFNRGMARRIDSATLRATAADSRNDVIATSAVLAAALLARSTGIDLDGWMGVGVALFILASGIGLVKDTLTPLLGAAPDAAFVRRVRKKIQSYPGILGTHDLIVHDYGPGRRFASAHVEMDSAEDVLKSHEIIDAIERDFAENERLHLIIHYDPIVPGGGVQGRVARRVAAIDPRLSIHDFRVENAEGGLSYIFDLAAPRDFAMTDEQLKARIEKSLAKGDDAPRVVMTVDRGYASIPEIPAGGEEKR